MQFAMPASALTIPGPRPRLRGYGNLMAFGRDPIGYLGRLFSEFGPISVLASGVRTRTVSPQRDCPGSVCVYGPELLRQITTNMESYHRYSSLKRLLPSGQLTARQMPLRYCGTGLFDANGDEHRRQRRLMQPAFYRKYVEVHHNTIVALANRAFDQWRSGQRRDMYQEMMGLTMQIAVSALFSDDGEQLGLQVAAAAQDALRTFGHPLTLLLPYDLPGLPYQRMLTRIGQLDAGMRRLIAHKRARGQGKDVLALLIAAATQDEISLSEEDLIGHATTLFIAGHETTATGLTWTLLLLSQHPALLSDLHDELVAVTHGGPPTVQQLQDMPLLDCVIKESLRILPVAPLNLRIAVQPDELAGYQIPGGTELFMSIYHTHHAPELYAEPERFNPRRWQSISPTAFEYIPFSSGPRACIGSALATMTLKLVLSILLQRFRLEAIPGTCIDRHFTSALVPRHGLPMIIRPPDREFGRGTGGLRGNIREMVALPA